jgi:tetratricopeptide (TPR) repeat protein
VTDSQDTRLRDIMSQSIELSKAGKIEEALDVLDKFLAKDNHKNAAIEIPIVSRHAEVLADVIGDRPRVRRYHEMILPYASDQAFAFYNLAQLYLRDSLADEARKWAIKSYELCGPQGTEANQDLSSAILKQWPDIASDGLACEPSGAT